MRWTKWRRAEGDRAPREIEGTGTDSPHMGVDEIRMALEARGVSRALSASLASRAALQQAGRDRKDVEALLDGMAIALEDQQSTEERLNDSLRGLREVERMMGAFSGELSKLDEVLEVLAAYVRRMRSSGGGGQDRTLH